MKKGKNVKVSGNPLPQMLQPWAEEVCRCCSTGQRRYEDEIPAQGDLPHLVLGQQVLFWASDFCNQLICHLYKEKEKKRKDPYEWEKNGI